MHPSLIFFGLTRRQSPMSNCPINGIRIAPSDPSSIAPAHRLALLRGLERLNDGSACHVERDEGTGCVFYLRKRTWADWLRESVAQFKAECGFAEEWTELKNARVAAMQTLASLLGQEPAEKLKTLIREAVGDESFRFTKVAEIIAPETLDLSNKSFQISGFETFDDRRRCRREHELNRLVESGQGPLRVDQVKDANGVLQTYVRTRSAKQAFCEFWMSAKERHRIESAACDAIAKALNPFLVRDMKGEGQLSLSIMAQNRRPQEQAADGSKRMRALMNRLEDAVLTSRSTQPDVNPHTPRFSISASSPLSLSCDVLMVGSMLPKFCGDGQGRATKASRKAFEDAKREQGSKWQLPDFAVDPASEGYVCLPHMVDLLGIDEDNHLERLESLKRLLYASSAPLRIESGRDQQDNKVLYLRERTWGEFFEEKIMGLVWPHQLSDMKRDTAFMIENKLGEVLAHIRKKADLSPGSTPIDICDVEDLLGELRHRVWNRKAGEGPLGSQCVTRQAARRPSGLHLKGNISQGIRHAPLIGCSVVQAHPLDFGANNIIVALAEARRLRSSGNRARQQSLAVAHKAERKFREQVDWLGKEAIRRRQKWGEEQAYGAQLEVSPEQADPTQQRRAFATARFPQKMQSVRHTPNLLLVDFPAALNGEAHDGSEQEWYDYYSALLSEPTGFLLICLGVRIGKHADADVALGFVCFASFVGVGKLC